MEDSILTSTKKALNIVEEDTAFDADIVMHINSVFSTLNQLGIGPADGYMIEDAVPVWSDFLGIDPRFNSVKTYVYLKVRLVFDVPQTAHLVNAIEAQIKELEWRLTAARETIPEEPVVIP